MHWCLGHLSSATHTTTNTDTPTHACQCNGPVSATSLPWKLLQPILSLVQASYRLLFAARPSAVSTLRRPTTARSRQQSKSTLAHDTVATALLYKHHPIIHVGSGPIQLVYASHSQLDAEFNHDKILFLPFCSRVFPVTVRVAKSGRWGHIATKSEYHQHRKKEKKCLCCHIN